MNRYGSNDCSLKTEEKRQSLQCGRYCRLRQDLSWCIAVGDKPHHRARIMSNPHEFFMKNR